MFNSQTEIILIFHLKWQRLIKLKEWMRTQTIILLLLINFANVPKITMTYNLNQLREHKTVIKHKSKCQLSKPPRTWWQKPWIKFPDWYQTQLRTILMEARAKMMELMMSKARTPKVDLLLYEYQDVRWKTFNNKKKCIWSFPKV